VPTKAIRWKLAEGKTWQMKLKQPHPNHGKIVRVPPRMQRRFGKGTMLIPRPLAVDALLRRVRAGRLMTMSAIREKLARDAGADYCCPLTTGLFVRIVAEAAEEDRRAGRKRITPYWRVVGDDGRLNEKFPGGVKAQAARLRAEGLAIHPAQGSRPPRVKDLEKHL
jgi:hypothetical protein